MDLFGTVPVEHNDKYTKNRGKKFKYVEELVVYLNEIYFYEKKKLFPWPDWQNLYKT